MRGPCLGLAIALLTLAGTLSAQQPIPPPSRPNFPVTVPGNGSNGSGAIRGGHPAFADLGLPSGTLSIVFGTEAGKLFVIRGDTGAVATGWPVTLPSEIVSTPAIGDIDQDGQPEIVVGYGSQFEPTSPGGIRAYKIDGTLLWERITGDFNSDGVSDAIVSAPAIGDVDGDGHPEVVFTSFDDNIYVVDGKTGANKTGWPHPVRDTIWSSPALFDIDGDGKPDIVVGADAHQEGPPYNTPNGGCLHALRYDATELPGFPICLNQVISSSPAIGDIDGDGHPEIVVGTGGFWPNGSHVLYAFRCDGSPVPGWPVPVDGQVVTSPALADLDGDGIPEVVVTDDTSGPSGIPAVYAFKGNGTRIFRTVPKDFFGQTLSAGDPAVGDVLGDGSPEILVPTNGEICVLSSTGTQLTYNGTPPQNGQLSFSTVGSLSAASVVDFEGDGTPEVVAISGSPFPNDTSTSVYVWNPKSGATPAGWGVFHQNQYRTGVVPATPPCAGNPQSFYTVAPCRVVDTRNTNGTYGGPALSAGSTRSFPLTGQCGIPSDARAVAANVTVVSPTVQGDLRVFPATVHLPITSVINFRAGQTRANNLVVGLGAGGIAVKDDQPSGTVQLLIDINGYFR